MKNFFIKLGAWVSILPLLYVPSAVYAKAADPGQFLDGDGAGVESSLGTQFELPVVIGNVINVLISVLGIIFVVLVVYAGYLYLTAAGEDKKVETAKKLLGQAVIGLVLVLAAYSISTFVINQLTGISATGLK
jgi:phage shock protein PspC (stress-responsive transcriptional regulator)